MPSRSTWISSFKLPERHAADEENAVTIAWEGFLQPIVEGQATFNTVGLIRGGRLRTRARIRYKKQERIQRHATVRISATLSGDQRSVLRLSREGYSIGEMARELALDPAYVRDFMYGLTQRLTDEGLIPSSEWRNVLDWAESEGFLA